MGLPRVTPPCAPLLHSGGALRILPLYYGILAVLFVLIPIFHPLRTTEYATLAHEQGWYWTYLQNWRIAFAHPMDGGSLVWFWSLAIEEQFYLICLS